jgi:hypothetical protein
MEYRYDLKLVACNFIKDRERETAHHGAPQTPVNDRIQVRMSDDSQKRVVDALYEFKVEVFALPGVPYPRLNEFGIGFGSEPNDHL